MKRIIGRRYGEKGKYLRIKDHNTQSVEFIGLHTAKEELSGKDLYDMHRSLLESFIGVSLPVCKVKFQYAKRRTTFKERTIVGEL